MLQNAYLRYCYIMEKLETDPEYLEMERRLVAQESAFRELRESLSPGQREVLTEYLGLLAELEERAMEIACFAP